MRLYLHAGTNKTGSSFLQTVLTQNRTQLLQQGVLVPASKWDERMTEGLISPGNGHQLAWLLSTEDAQKTKLYLSQLVQQARQQNVNKVVLSNEILIRLFSNQNILEILTQSAHDAGFDTIHCLCLLRNPYEHALSLFKHRAKSGKWGSYEEWLEKNYETLRVFKPFLSCYEQFSIDWEFRLYRKDSDYLLNTLFSDFLEVRKMDYTDIKKVNTSLSLNQIRIINFFETMYPGIHRYLFDSLSTVSGKNYHCENEQHLKAVFYQAFKKYKQRYEHVIQHLATLLPESDVSCFMHQPDYNSCTVESYLTMNQEEEEGVVQAVEKYKKKKIRRSVKKIFQKVRRLTLRFQDDHPFDSERYGGSLRRLHNNG